MIDGPTIQTASGQYVNPLEPWTFVPRIEDIAHALSHQCRFSGHTRRAYSVAEHCVRVSDEVGHTDPPHALHALLHDASEAYLVDLPRPLKHAPGFGDGYRQAERLLSQRLAVHFGLSGFEPQSVRDADLRLLETERRDLMPPGPGWRLTADVEPLSERIKPWPAWVARSKFLERYQELTHQRTARRAA